MPVTGSAGHLPVAYAGNDKSYNVGKKITLDGSGSINYYKTGSDALWYYWTLESAPPGSQEVLSDALPNNPKREITLDMKGKYIFSLFVYDHLNRSSITDYVTITAGNAFPTKAPLAHAGGIQYIKKKDLPPTITLNASGSQGEGFSLRYRWTPIEYPFNLP
ncbi:MAG: hypothetical protein GY757_61145, partial [bacterium]|nr:hypothetical protein [bacterium]